MSGQLISAQEDERKRIARELHDDLNQQVADLGISLSNIKRSVPPTLSNVCDELLSAQNRLVTLSDGIRHISHELHPGMLEFFGLVAALKSHCEEFSIVTSIPVEFTTDCKETVVSDVALCVYRVAQESLPNAAKHSRATKVEVRLTQSENMLQLRVADNGIGFDIDDSLTNGGLGLRSMEERVRLMEISNLQAGRPAELLFSSRSS